MSPSKEKSFPLQLQIREISQERRLDNYKKYCSVWQTQEKNVENHFKQQDIKLKGKKTEKEVNKVTKKLKDNIAKLMIDAESFVDMKKSENVTIDEDQTEQAENTS